MNTSTAPTVERSEVAIHHSGLGINITLLTCPRVVEFRGSKKSRGSTSDLNSRGGLQVAGPMHLPNMRDRWGLGGLLVSINPNPQSLSSFATFRGTTNLKHMLTKGFSQDTQAATISRISDDRAELALHRMMGTRQSYTLHLR
jgi:hypothetical protein